jgi:hypothetical protein
VPMAVLKRIAHERVRTGIASDLALSMQCGASAEMLVLGRSKDR